jgi:hypothetical protein
VYRNEQPDAFLAEAEREARQHLSEGTLAWNSVTIGRAMMTYSFSRRCVPGLTTFNTQFVFFISKEIALTLVSMLL